MSFEKSPPPNTSDTAVIAANLRRHVDMLAGLIGSRHMGRPSSMDATKAYIQREFESAGDAVERETYPVQHHEAQNLIVNRVGAENPLEVVILGAHYDTVTTTPGADDNASAVAVLLEVARLSRKTKAQRTIRFVAFANEEPPHFYTDTMGSQIHARSCRAKNELVHGMICLEMVGYFSNEPGSQRYPVQIPKLAQKLLPSKGNFIGIVSNLSSTSLLKDFCSGFKSADAFAIVAVPLPEAIQEIRLSDHAQFWDQQYPALMVTDTSFFRNPHYHKASDTPDTLNYQSMAHVALGVTGAVLKIAGRV